MTLPEFVLARVAEDADFWQEATWNGPQGEHRQRQMLLDCAAKWRIVDLHTGRDREDWQKYMRDFDPSCSGSHGDDRYIEDCDTLKALASAYADHPDYREEWKP